MTVPDPAPVENPYSPPAAVDREEREPRNKRPGYRKQVRSVVGMIGLAIITVGLYESIWYVLRQEFIDSRRSNEKIGALPVVILVGHILSLLISVVAIASNSADTGSIGNFFSLALGVVSLVLRFRVARILRADFQATGRELGVSGAGTFFFGALYLQHKINQAAETPRHRAA